MATSEDFIEYVCEQIAGAGDVSYIKMFGEYGLYLNGKVIAFVCDNQLFLKITEAGRALISEPVEAPAYVGSRPYFLIEDLDDRKHMTALVKATYEELPEPKPKRPKGSKKRAASKKEVLKDLPNIGNTLQAQLLEVGIITPNKLKSIGSRKAWLRIKAIDPSACFMRLCALEGAIRGIRWHDLDTETKQELKDFCQSHKKKG